MFNYLSLETIGFLFRPSLLADSQVIKRLCWDSFLQSTTIYTCVWCASLFKRGLSVMCIWICARKHSCIYSSDSYLCLQFRYLFSFREIGKYTKLSFFFYYYYLKINRSSSYWLKWKIWTNPGRNTLYSIALVHQYK